MSRLAATHLRRCPLPAAGGSRPRRRRWLRVEPRRGIRSRPSRSLAAGGYWIAALGPAPLRRGPRILHRWCVDRDGRLLRPYATPEGRWRLPATRERRRSALSRHAARLRGQALPRASRRRSARARPRVGAAGRATAASSPAARPSPCRSRGCSSRAASAASRRSCARWCARSQLERALEQGRDPRALSQPRALWRQSRRRARRLARLFRQGAAPA